MISVGQPIRPTWASLVQYGQTSHVVSKRKGFMDRLCTPWRMKYISSNNANEKGCVFCNDLAADPAEDHKNLVVYRGENTFAMMNLYPYNTGHLMILPNAHVPVLIDLTRKTQIEMMLLTTYFTDLLTQVMKPDGLNVGLNLGSAAGAGIPGHLHLHIVPRWNSDSNFMTTIGNTRVLPELIEDTYDRIVAWLQQHPPAK